MNTLSFRTVFSYGTLGLPLAMLGLPLYIYLPTYYAHTLGVGMYIVGVLLMAARIIDMIADPIIGFVNDRYLTTIGCKKGSLITGAVMLVISFYALLHPTIGYEALWLFGYSVLAYVGWSMINIPYLAHSANLSPNYHEKTRLSGMRELFTILGGISAIILPYMLGVADDSSQTLPLLYMAFVCSLIIALPLALRTFTSTLTQLHSQSHTAKKLWRNINTPLVGAFFINSLANALPATLFLLYVDGCLGVADSTGLLLLLYFVSGVVALPAWIYLSRKLGKRNTWMASMAISSMAFLCVPLLNSGDLGLFVAICIVSGLSLGADMALPASMQADIAQQTDGTAGVLFGVWAMITKLSLALAVGIGFVILGLVGYDSTNPDPRGQLTLSLLYGTLPVVLKMIALWLMRGYHEDESTKKGYEQI